MESVLGKWRLSSPIPTVDEFEKRIWKTASKLKLPLALQVIYHRVGEAKMVPKV